MSGRWPSSRAAALYLGLALLLTQVHAYQVNFGEHERQRSVRHEKVLDGRGESPWVYRTLSPRLAEATRTPLAVVISPQVALEASYLGWRLVWTALFLWLFHRWLREWVDAAWATAGTLLAAALHAPSYRFYWFQPDSPLDLVVWTAAAWCSRTGRDAWLYPLVFFGTLNRETAVFALVIHGALRWGEEPRRRLLLRLAGLFAAFAIPFFGIRAWIGPQPASVAVGEALRANANPEWLAYAAAFLGALWVLPWIGRDRPRALVRLAQALMITYLPLQFLFGRIREVRLLLPLAVALIPLALLALREERREGPPR